MHTTYTQHVSTAAQQFIAQQNSKTFHSSAFFFRIEKGEMKEEENDKQEQRMRIETAETPVKIQIEED